MQRLENVGLVRRSIVAALLLAACGGAGSEPAVEVPSSVTVSPENITFSRIGETATVTANVRNSLDNGIRYPVRWETSDANYATVSSNGVVTAVRCGKTAHIRAVAGAVSAEALARTTLPPSTPATETYASSLGVNIASMNRVNNSLYSQDIAVGTGATAANGARVTVQYQQWLANGTGAVSGQLVFTLGNEEVIGGWDLGIVGMRVGGKRRLVIGSSLANAGSCAETLVADITLVSRT